MSKTLAKPKNNPELFKQLGENIRRVAIEALRGIPKPENAEGPTVTLTCNIDQTIADIDAHVEALRRDFQYDEANPFDKLLIEQILVAWVQWYVASWLLDGQLAQSRSWRENQYFIQRYELCQSRLTRAIDQLARIRLINPKRLRLETQEDRDAKAERLRLLNTRFPR